MSYILADFLLASNHGNSKMARLNARKPANQGPPTIGAVAEDEKKLKIPNAAHRTQRI
jgi:hypothetical protein